MDTDVDELFSLPPERFTGARDALVKRLRSEKRRDEAEAVKALRRPTVAAWAVNRTVRAHPELVDQLIAAGGDLNTAQRRALSGVKEAGLRQAAATRRERLDDVWRRAAILLQEAGVEPSAHRQAVTSTFEAASVDGDAAAQVRAARLSRELPAPSGFGDVVGLSVVPEGAPAAEVTAAPDATVEEAAAAEEAAVRRAVEQARRKAEQAEQRASELAERAGAARQAAMRADAEAHRLEGRARQARRRAEEAAAEADERRRQVDRAQAAAAEAAAALRTLTAGAD